MPSRTIGYQQSGIMVNRGSDRIIGREDGEIVSLLWLQVNKRRLTSHPSSIKDTAIVTIMISTVESIKTADQAFSIPTNTGSVTERDTESVRHNIA
jgi:hypothetical protein